MAVASARARCTERNQVVVSAQTGHAGYPHHEPKGEVVTGSANLIFDGQRTEQTGTHIHRNRRDLAGLVLPERAAMLGAVQKTAGIAKINDPMPYKCSVARWIEEEPEPWLRHLRGGWMDNRSGRHRCRQR